MGWRDILRSLRDLLVSDPNRLPKLCPQCGKPYDWTLFDQETSCQRYGHRDKNGTDHGCYVAIGDTDRLKKVLGEWKDK